MTEGDRTGMAEAQMELARRTIDHSTNSALNRLKWIRRNKDKQDLTNLQIDINFSNQMLASLTEAVKTSAIQKKINPLKIKMYFIGAREVFQLEKWETPMFQLQKKLMQTL